MQIKKLLMTGVVIATLATSIIPVSAAPTATTPMPVVALDANDKAVLKLLFDAEYYAAQYPDLAAAFGDNEEALFNHFCVHGINEGRSLSKDFHVAAYKSAYKDLQDAFGDDVMAYYTHYVLTKDVENRVVTTVKKAQEEGITVTNFAGERVVENADGKVLTGKSAEKTIQRSSSKKSSSSSSSSSNAGSGDTNPAAPTIEDIFLTTQEGYDINALRGTSRQCIVELHMSDGTIVQSNPTEWIWNLDETQSLHPDTSIDANGLLVISEEETNYIVGVEITNKKDASLYLYHGYQLVEVASVDISPTTVTLNKGESIQFEASVRLRPNEIDILGVDWSIPSGLSNGTKISEDGLLIVADDETAENIEVKATSKLDNSVVGTVTVTITEPTL